ncbi:MAG TPA: glycoside hydrolase family 2 TIM barrel-domain containing protein [Symbiobacteriaceae bacterium]|nr:glycoside hydrolase family 2 TIM barrel-domain containing protein [Symbiobacteriaceae bacterium]
MAQRISLGGRDWQFKGFVGEDWIWRNAEKPDTKDVRWWYQGAVPGTVQHDLWERGLIPNPYFETNSLQIEWAHQRTWIYRKQFLADQTLKGQQVRLCFDGVDYAAQFYLNGEKLGEHAGMFVPVSFDVTEKLKYGQENHLSVVLEPAPPEQPQVSKTSKVRTHKSRMTYWWDFCPRMPHVGIWDEVYLEVTGPARIENVFVRPVLTEDLQRADVQVSVALSGGPAKVQVVIRDGDQIVAETEGEGSEFSLPIIDPKLWWPNGAGEQPIYDLEVRITGSDTRRIPFGIRKVAFVANETPDDTARPYTIVVNGKRIYAKGWNWVPIDVMYGVERPAKLEHLLTLARQAGVNLLRIWGGGLIEKEAFYDLCDRFGIMVWQEFIQSSSGIENKPSTEPEFIEMMVREAEAIIPKRRNHPSLVIWCGGNELQGLDGLPLDDTEPVLAALKATVARLDPDRYWLATSPTGRQFSNTIKTIEQDPLGMHDVHGPWEHQGLTEQYTLYNRGACLLHSEFGAEGMTNLETLNATISPANQWPATRDNPVYFHLGSWWVNEPLVQKAFGGISEIVSLQKASQFLQHEALRYALEADRRRAYQCSGTLPWQFNEPYPNGYCTSAVDYYGIPKPGYWGVRKAYEPLAITARFASQVWPDAGQFEAEMFALNSDHHALVLDLVVRVVGLSGRVYLSEERPAAVKPDGTTELGAVSLPLDGVEELFFLDLTLGGAQNRYLFARTPDLAPMLAAPTTRLTIERDNDWTLIIRNDGDSTALNVRLDDGRPLAEREGYVYVSDNYFSLLPGEARTVRVNFTGIDEPHRQVAVYGWNTEVIRLGGAGLASQ